MSAVYYTITCFFLMFIAGALFMLLEIGTTSLNTQKIPLFHHYIYSNRQEFTAYTPEQIKGKVARLMRELICDADAKVMSIQYIKREFAQSGKFHLGELIYNIRNKFGFMIRKLQLTEKQIDLVWSKVWPNDKFIKYTMQMQLMFQDIDHMVQMAVEYDETDPSGRLFGRMGPIVDEDENIDEENLRRTKNLKQIAYMERKKKEWAIRNGYDISNKSTQLMLRNKNKEEGGFDSDIN